MERHYLGRSGGPSVPARAPYFEITLSSNFLRKIARIPAKSKNFSDRETGSSPDVKRPNSLSTIRENNLFPQSRATPSLRDLTSWSAIRQDLMPSSDRHSDPSFHNLRERLPSSHRRGVGTNLKLTE